MSVIQGEFSAKGLKKLAKELRKYNRTLDSKIEEYLRLLTEEGIRVARLNEGKFAGYMAYSVEVKGRTATLIASDIQKIIAEYYKSKTSPTPIIAEVSPLLMAEFGSGSHAIDGLDGAVGQGTFPNQTHAFDAGGWFWIDENPSDNIHDFGNGRYLHHSSGESPTQPMHNAIMQMISIASVIARRIL